MDHEGKAILGSLAGILSYMVLLVVSIGDVMRNYEAMVHISPLHVSFLITLALVIFWFLQHQHIRSPKRTDGKHEEDRFHLQAFDIFLRSVRVDGRHKHFAGVVFLSTRS